MMFFMAVAILLLFGGAGRLKKHLARKRTMRLFPRRCKMFVTAGVLERERFMKPIPLPIFLR